MDRAGLADFLRRRREMLQPEDVGLPRLNDAQIALMRASHAYGGIYDALATHIVASMGNLEGRDTVLEAAE